MNTSPLEAAIALLRTIVKYSAVPGQKHLDFSLVNSHELEKYQQAMMVGRGAIISGEIDEEDFKRRLGLINT